MSRFKIALFHNLRSGGAKRTLKELFKRISTRYEIDVYSLNFNSKKDFNFANKIELFSFPLTKNFLLLQKRILFDLLNLHRNIAEQINNGNYDLVYVGHDIFTKSPYILRFLKRPSVYFCHEPPREFYEDNQIFSTTLKYKLVNLLRLPLKYIDKTNVKYADLVLANSKYSQKVLKRIYKRKIGRLTWGIDKMKFIWQREKRKNFFLSVGALAKFKGHDFIINSLSLLPKKKRFSYYVVANGGRDEKFLKRLAEKKNVKLVIKRNTTDKELVNLYNQAKLLLVGSYNEPLGLTVLEAGSCGLPVVAVGEGGIKETLTQKFQGFTTKRNEEQFAKTVNKALEKKFNEKEIRNYIINKWQWQATINQLENYIRQLCRVPK